MVLVLDLMYSRYVQISSPRTASEFLWAQTLFPVASCCCIIEALLSSDVNLASLLDMDVEDARNALDRCEGNFDRVLDCFFQTLSSTPEQSTSSPSAADPARTSVLPKPKPTSRELSVSLPLPIGVGQAKSGMANLKCQLFDGNARQLLRRAGADPHTHLRLSGLPHARECVCVCVHMFTREHTRVRAHVCVRAHESCESPQGRHRRPS